MPRHFFNTIDHDCHRDRFVYLLPLFFWLACSAHSEPVIPRHSPSFESAPLFRMSANNISVSLRYTIANSDVPESVNASLAIQVATYFNNRSSHFVIQHQKANDDGLDLCFLVRMKDKCNPKNTRETLMRNLVNHAQAARENMKCMIKACTDLETQYLDSDNTCTKLVWTCSCSSAQAANLLPNEATQATAAVKDSSPASAQACTTASPSKCFGAPVGESELAPQDRNDSAAAGAIHRPAMVDRRFLSNLCTYRRIPDEQRARTYDEDQHICKRCRA
jgi:hypothetical protein